MLLNFERKISMTTIFVEYSRFFPTFKISAICVLLMLFLLDLLLFRFECRRIPTLENTNRSLLAIVLVLVSTVDEDDDSSLSLLLLLMLSMSLSLLFMLESTATSHPMLSKLLPTTTPEVVPLMRCNPFVQYCKVFLFSL